MYIKIKNFRWSDPEKMLDLILVLIIVTHFFLVSTFWHWWGGYSIGPRLMTDVIPLLIYFLIPVIAYLTNSTSVSAPIKIVFIVAALISLLMQWHGAASEAMYAWNNIPTSIDLDQARLWDWSDPLFHAGIPWINTIQ